MEVKSFNRTAPPIAQKNLGVYTPLTVVHRRNAFHLDMHLVGIKFYTGQSVSMCSVIEIPCHEKLLEAAFLIACSCS